MVNARATQEQKKDEMNPNNELIQFSDPLLIKTKPSSYRLLIKESGIQGSHL